MIGFNTNPERSAVGSGNQAPSDVRLSMEVVAVIAAFIVVAIGLAFTANMF